MGRTVALLTLGCARNDVDADELAGRLSADGWTVTTDPAGADVVMVNTCGFIDAAKKDSIDTLLSASDLGAPVVAVGCLAERYGGELAETLPEATVLGFDDYPEISARLDDVLAGRPVAAPIPQDRRALLPISPVERPAAAQDVPGHATGVGPVPASGPRILRQRLEGGPMAPLKIASGCDRRCAFCAIPRWRGAFVSRPFDDIVAEAQMLAADGVRELLLVSENSTSYGKDIGDIRMLDKLLVALTRVDGIERVRVSYLQPAELRPDLVELIVRAPKVAPYLDLSFQHASPTLLRRMRRFGDSESFLQLLRDGRRHSPDLGARTNVIVGFPGEDERDLLILENFLIAARFDAIGVFGYSDEEDTEGAELDGKIPDEQIAERVERISRLVDYVTAQRAEDRIGQDVQVLVESLEDGPEGRAAHQGPDDGVTRLELPRGREVAVGNLVDAVVVASDGIDLVARPRTHLPLTS